MTDQPQSTTTETWWGAGWRRRRDGEERMAIFHEETAARQEVEALCERLRARGDQDSLDAAGHIFGTLDAYAALVAERHGQHERLREMRANLDATHRLWSRVPFEVRHEVVHGKQGAVHAA